MDFVHLHTHSHFSLLDGLGKIPLLVARAKEFGMKAIALTDHGVLYGAIEFYQTCAHAGIKPLIGVETYVTSRGRHKKAGRIDDERFHLILLSRTTEGYHNLVKMITKAHLEGFYYKPRIDFELLREFGDGLIATSACINGQLAQAILRGNDPEPILRQYLEIFGTEHFFLELQNHPNLPEQKIVNDALISISRKHGLRLVATADSHYLDPDDSEAHDILLCLQTKKALSDNDRMCMLGEDFSFTDGSAIREAFSHVPDAIENTLRIADMCDIKIEFGTSVLPYFEVPATISTEEYLHALCESGMQRRYGDTGTDQMRKRLSYELSVITNAGFASYFLIVHDFVAWAKKQGIVVGPGRGSAAGSLVAYVLGITNIDPIAYDLLFERFLNPERISMPDIDLDFTDTRRDEVLSYVEEKYGSDHVAQIITFGTMAARVSIRDVGRVLELPYSFCDSLAKMFPANLTIQNAIESISEVSVAYESDDRSRRVLDIAKKLEGVARHTSIHACGVVITKEPVVQYAPCQYVSLEDRRLVTQYSLHAIEDLGLLKIDFLGLSNLTILEHAKNIVAKTHGMIVDYDTIPLDNKKTFKLLKEGRTTGVFQLESGGMRRYLKKLRPTEIEDIIAMVALYRPGPMEWIPDYINRKHGRTMPTYIHDSLRPILSKTYGIAIYQEQVMKIAQDLAGFSLGEADVLRKAVGKKIKKLLTEQRAKFIEGAIKNGIEKSIATQVFDFIEPFAGYGFNRSHAACYAVIAYQTAYMKANFPSEFMAALMTSDKDNSDRIALEIEECKAMGVEVLPPDINESFETFTVVPSKDSQSGTKIRFGLLAIKNLGEHVVESIVSERKRNGQFESLEAFLQRLPGNEINKKSIESLIRCGALDRFGDRIVLYYNCDRILDLHRELAKYCSSKQGRLFATDIVKPTLCLEEPAVRDERQLLAWEKELLGLYLTEHPLHRYQNIMKHFVVTSEHVKTLRDNSVVKLSGVITSIKKIHTKKNDSMLFVRLEDLSGSLEVIVFPTVLAETEHAWRQDSIIVVEGRISLKDEDVKVICTRVRQVNDDFVATLSAILSKNQTQTEQTISA
ncbi:DNA polymerase III subunit alpha [Candidatus Uhrbacteria bacterium]|nr:DNA polymerase III subunit alpha [Candidatus Uhrbacteria bacterium]